MDLFENSKGHTPKFFFRKTTHFPPEKCRQKRRNQKSGIPLVSPPSLPNSSPRKLYQYDPQAISHPAQLLRATPTIKKKKLIMDQRSTPASRLPAHWADALAPHARGAVQGGAHVPGPATGEDFDGRLDAFLDGVTTRLVAARAAKAAGGAGAVFAARMAEVRAMWEAEGADLRAVLEARYPGFAAGIGSGTGGKGEAEVVDGIRRLEMCLKEEEGRRANRRVKRAQGQTAVLGGTYQREVARELGSGAYSTAATTRTMHSDETLCLMQNDIQALKLELLRLQRSKASEPGDEADRDVTPLSVAGPGVISAQLPYSHIPLTSSTVTPPSNSNQTSPRGSAPRYVSHLEHMKNRLDALERRPLPPPGGLTGRSKSAVRVGRAPAPPSGMGSGSVSVARLPAHRGKSSVLGIGADDAPGPGGVGSLRRETLTTSNHFVTPPQGERRMKPTGRSMLIDNEEARKKRSSIIRTIGDEGFASPNGSNTSDSPSPRPLLARGMSRTFTAGAKEESARPSVKSKLFSIDAPEDMLSRPQSFAAARDIQRYSLKVAKRKGPVPAESGNGPAQPGAHQASASVSGPASNSGIPKHPATTTAAAAAESSSTSTPKKVQDSALVTFSMSPTRESARPGVRKMISLEEARAAAEKKTKSETAVAVASARVAEARKAAAAAAASAGPALDLPKVATPKVAPAASRTSHEPPNTMDTTVSAGSNGPVVEEMEGDMWVRKGTLWKRWRKRYASIVSHKFFGRVLCLFSYDSAGAVISSRSEIIVLSGALCRSLRDPVDIGGMENFVFVLRTGKEYYFASDSDTERRAWVRELRQAARSSAPVTNEEVSVVSAEGNASKATCSGGSTIPTVQYGVVPAPADRQDGKGQENVPPTNAPTIRKASGLVSRKSAIGIGRSITHHGGRRPTPNHQSGSIPTGQSYSQHRWVPFRRPSVL